MGEIVLKSKLFTSSCLNYRQNVHDRVHDQQIRSSLQFPLLKSESWLSLNSQFYGRRIGFIADERKMGICRRGKNQSANAQMMSIGIGKAQKWWERGLKDNIIEITSTQHLVDSLSNAGDQLVVLAFFSPGCGGCKALHPKLCQLAEQNPEVKFLHVNYEEHKSMCCSLNVHVLPFFRFYRGAHGRVCSFSCTNATIKKFRDALAKYGPEQCSIGPTKGLEEKELIALSANRDLDFTYTPKPMEDEIHVEEQEEIPTPANTIATTSSSSSNSPMPLPLPLPLPLSLHDNSTTSEENLVAAGR